MRLREGSSSVSDSQKVSTWWALLRAIAVLNILIWAYTCAPLAGGGTLLSYQVALSGVYVAVCAFRSWLPRIDLERWCLIDSPLSSMFLGRTAATVAEVAFAAQVAICLHRVGELSGLVWIEQVSYAVVPLLALAQCFCWYSVITLNHMGHAIEQSLWTLTMAGVGLCLAGAISRLSGGVLLFAWIGAIFSMVFVLFMSFVDVPMYLRRWRAGRLERRAYLSLREGVRDALYRRITTRDWATWRPEVAWLTSYFSVAVWLSIALVQFTAS